MTRPTVYLHDGTALPALGQGTWHMGEGRSPRKDEIAVLQRGLELGLKVIDTAEMYGNGGSEEVVGEALKGRRDQAFLVSKMLPGNAGYHNVRDACERSLRRLQTETLDLYLLHWRGAASLEETIDSLGRLREEGKIQRFGVSNFDVSDMADLQKTAFGPECTTNQVLYHMASRGIEYALMPEMARLGMPVMAYSPLSQGGGRHFQRLSNHPLLSEIAKHHHASVTQILLAWAIRAVNGEHRVLAIPKTSNEAHLEANVAAMDITLSPQELENIDGAFPPPSAKQPLDII
ncbi:aldo/keto reductase [Larsenimonas suaedae]|uniref:Aldo/keto reductase n=1 Tax=Larsenimonas suaedae TaxID=1851019 RepID=A0ABU1GTB2_9GAMM|nr:aldo/keto reductase [Larsenimonas suaedae]MCM2971716.1 aldo/keto reductase [Larsenimonas suaedae]MDR5895268.1 aldo/keto reductase [Larsenimonas suaedae]